MNWGNKLIIVFIVFAALMATLVYKATHTKFELVSKEYYNDELTYQDRIDGAANSSKLGELSVTKNTAGVLLSFPNQMKNKIVKGEAWFYSKTDATQDRKIAITIDENAQQLIAFDQLAKAGYTIKINWTEGNKKYYSEKEINLR